MRTRTQIMFTAATCDEQDAWTDMCVAYGWLVPTREDTKNVLCHRELFNASMDSTIGYVMH